MAEQSHTAKPKNWFSILLQYCCYPSKQQTFNTCFGDSNKNAAEKNKIKRR